jgi:ATP-dependent protease HslVU (ClpYQ) ATPase subunit
VEQNSVIKLIWWGEKILKAAELKNKGIKFKLNNKEYELKFDMNTFCELEEVYGDINQAFEDLQNRKIKAIRALIYSAIKAEDESVTLKEVGKMLTLNDMERLGTAINEALVIAMPEVTENMGE